MPFQRPNSGLESNGNIEPLQRMAFRKYFEIAEEFFSDLLLLSSYRMILFVDLVFTKVKKNIQSSANLNHHQQHCNIVENMYFGIVLFIKNKNKYILNVYTILYS